MARTHFWQFLINKEGQPIEGAEISIYEAGTLTPVRVFSSEFGSTYVSLSPQVTTNEKGYFEFWIADKEEVAGYEPSQKFKIAWNKTGVESGYVDWIDILDFVSYPVDETDAANIIKNKLVSNSLAYKWDRHTSKLVENEVVHGLSAANPNDQDTTYNKVVSNKVLYDIINTISAGYLKPDGSINATDVLSYENTVDTFLGDYDIVHKKFVEESITTAVSSGNVYTTSLTTGDWTTSTTGDGVYITITHNLNIDYPNVEIYRTSVSPYEKIIPSKIQRVNSDSLRLYYPQSVTSQVRITP